MSDAPWQLDASAEANATLQFAWNYMTDVSNWDDPPAEFTLEGPFADGSRGSTRMPGQEPRQWVLRDIRPLDSYTVEFPLPGATFSTVWTFEAIDARRTRLTQRLALEGENAAAYAADTQAAFGPTLAPGMRRIAAAIERAAAVA
jgi:hypothetical protein